MPTYTHKSVRERIGVVNIFIPFDKVVTPFLHVIHKDLQCLGCGGGVENEFYFQPIGPGTHGSGNIEGIVIAQTE